MSSSSAPFILSPPAALEALRTALPPSIPSSVSTFLYRSEKWTQHILSLGNERVKDWPLTNPLSVLLTASAYLLTIFVLVQIMKRREKPVNVYWLALIHNINMTLLSGYMFTEILRQAITNNYSLFSNGVDNSPAGEGMARVIYIFYLSKIVEFIDTVIMALKKNFHQITFLHLYHHASIFVVWWVIFYYAPGGESYFSAMLNSFIHVVMYGYYLWATFAPKLPEGKRPSPFHPGFYRPYITRMQLTQFCIMFVQAVYDIVYEIPTFPRTCAWILFFYMLTMLSLFGNFYLQAYVKGGNKKSKSAKETKKEQ